MANQNRKHVPFAHPSIGEEEIQEVVDTLRSGWLTTGDKTRRFEAEFAKYTGAKHALCVNSGTAALHLSLEAVGIKPGDKVVTTVYTFTATAEVVRYLGGDPVFVDIDEDSLNLTDETVTSGVEDWEKVKAIVPVHIAGQACELHPLLELAKEKGLHVIEDAAHALPCTYCGRQVGTLGDLTCFSFYATKTLVTGEGGMVVTDSDAYAERIRVMRLHGISRDVFDRYRGTQAPWYYEVIAPGFKYNMTDVAASMGLHQLKKAGKLRERRESIAQQYTDAFADLPIITPEVANPEDVHSWHLYIIKLDLEHLTVDRDEVIRQLGCGGVGTSVHIIPLHLQPYWRDRYKLVPDQFPVADRVFRRVISLPIYPAMSDADVEFVIRTVRSVIKSVLR